MSKKGVINITSTFGAFSTVMQKVSLAPIREIELSKLEVNPHNAIFRREDESYFEKLEADIRQRGIIVPLIIRRSENGLYRIIAGHNRFEIAKTIGLKSLPVQEITSRLDEKTEREFVIKDNLLRRQLTSGERIDLYIQLYGKDAVEKLFDPNEKQGRKSANDTGLTIAQVASDTGQTVHAIKHQVQREKEKRRKEKKEPMAPLNGTVKKKEIELSFSNKIATFEQALNLLQEVYKKASESDKQFIQLNVIRCAESIQEKLQ